MYDIFLKGLGSLLRGEILHGDEFVDDNEGKDFSAEEDGVEAEEHASFIDDAFFLFLPSKLAFSCFIFYVFRVIFYLQIFECSVFMGILFADL